MCILFVRVVFQCARFERELNSSRGQGQQGQRGLAKQVLRGFLATYNRRFGRAPREAEKAWRPAPAELDRICCFHHERSVSNDNVVQWDGRRFHVPPQPQRFSFAGAKVRIHESLDGNVDIYYGESKLQHAEGVTFSSGR